MCKMMGRVFYGLRWRLLLLVLLACAPLVGLMLHTAAEERRRLVKDWNQRAQDLKQLATREEAQLIGQTRQFLLALAESGPVRSGNRQESQKLLDELFGSYPRYANLGVVRTNGTILASAVPIEEPANQSNFPYFRRALKGRTFSIGGFPDGQTVDQLVVNFGFPVLNSTGEIQAVVFASLDLDWVSRSESRLPAELPGGATWTEIDRTGRIILRYPSPEKWIGRPFPDKSLLETFFSQDRGVVEKTSVDGIQGYHVFAVMHSLLVPGETITILGSIPRQLLFADADRRLARNLTALGILAAFAFLLGWIGSDLLVLRPVRALVRSSALLAAGELGTRTGMARRGDELGQLTRTFDEMAQSLEQREERQRSADYALKVSETRYRRLFESAQDGILILNADTGQIDDVNPFLIDMLGYSREQFLGNKLWEIGPFKDARASQEAFRDLQRNGYVRYEDLPLETSAGKSINVEFVSNIYQVNGSKVVQCNIRDITKRKHAEDKRQEYSLKLQVLSRRLVEAQEAERRNIARELHDELGQTLTVAQLHLQALLLSTGDEHGAHAQASLEAVERVLEQVRDISLNLRPSLLDDLGLVPALVWLTNRQAALAGLTIDLKADALEQRVDAMIETECFRITQEALTNVVRHAGAKVVTVELREENGKLHLRIRDDGIGFEVGSVRQRAVDGASLGLLSMEERAALAGGGLEITSAPGKGSEVHAWFPLRWRTPPSEGEPS